MKYFVLFLLVAAALFAGSGVASSPLRLEESMEAMGTTFTIIVYGDDRQKMQAAVDEAFDAARQLDRLLSNYRPESEWSQVNKYAAERPVKVSKELFDLLSACLQYSIQSEGAFDITVGPLMKVWGFFKGSGRMPHRAEVRGALTKVDYRYITLDPKQLTVRFRKSGVEMDPGGIGKGYAVDKMAALLRAAGIKAALVNAGSSSIYGIGAPPTEPRGWKLSIRHPKDSNSTIQEVFLKDMSMSTSGTYEKFIRSGGRMYSHIMDPRTGFPAPGMLSVSVLAPKTLDSEAWTKPFFINGRKWAEANKPKALRAYFCEDRSELACAWVQ